MKVLIRFTLANFAAVLFCFSAHAASPKLVADCTQKNDMDLKIAACSALSKDAQFMKVNRRAIHGMIAGALLTKLEMDQAIAYLDKALQADPKFGVGLAMRGVAWSEKGETARAQADFDEAVRVDPKNPEVFQKRAVFLWNSRELDKALADLDEAIRLLPHPIMFSSRALIWRDKGDLDRALADDNRAISLDPKFAGAYANRGEIWRLKGDLDRALDDQSKAIKLSPQHSYDYVLRGDTFRYKDDFERALADYAASLKIKPDFVPAFVGRGLTYEKMGNVAAARAEYEKAQSSHEITGDIIVARALETARAHMAALASGAVQPAILAAPAKATSQTSLPTPAASVPSQPVSSPHNEGRRVALVIGNSAYANVPALENPKNDAQAIATSLRNIGFENVTLVIDATREKLIDALRSFANEAETSGWAMVYYAGHGIEVGGINYLIPIDAKLAVDRDIEYEAVSVSQVLRAADSARKIKLVMLDACRDNPFKPRKTDAPAAIAASEATAGRAIATRSTNGRGLAEVKVTGGTLVVFAAKDGQVALDGEGGNSPFAVAVVQRIATPGVEINKVFRLVRDDVVEATAGRQEPYTYGSLPGKEDFFFVAK
jgi:tetratricopeptide (TPR) repeat protein